jgi:hypothetical protein
MLPEVLERSSIRLSDIKRPTGTVGEGTLVRLFPVSRKRMRSVSDSKRTLWIVRSPNASCGFPSEWEDAQKLRAKITLPTKAGSFYERRANAKVTNGKAKGQRPLVKGKKKPLMSDERETRDGTETDDPSDEEEGDAENDNDEEVEEGGNGEEAEDEEAEEEGGTENHNAAKNVTNVRKAADKRRDRQDEGEENREEYFENEQERGKEAEEAGDKVEKPSETKEKDGADEDEQAEGNEDDEEAEAESVTPEEVREDRETAQASAARATIVRARRMQPRTTCPNEQSILRQLRDQRHRRRHLLPPLLV